MIACIKSPTRVEIISTMSRIKNLTIIFLVLPFFVLVASSNETEVSCETQCKYGCCPHINGVCCQDETECCREGQTCMPHASMCIGMKSTENGNFSLYSEKTTPVGGLLCPEKATTCSKGCCPHSNGVCCNDGYSCCPKEYECTSDGCLSYGGDISILLKKSLVTQDPENTAMGKKLNDMGIKICPDKLHLCPGNADCCRRDDGTWDCCPKVSNVQKGECCHQYLLWICCPDFVVPKCHWWGCWFS